MDKGVLNQNRVWTGAYLIKTGYGQGCAQSKQGMDRGVLNQHRVWTGAYLIKTGYGQGRD